MSFDFSQRNSFRLKAKKLGYVTLGKKTWEHATEERHREHIRYNEQLLKETLQNPERIIQEDDPSIYLYVKKIKKYRIKPGITVDAQRFRYFTIVVQKDLRFIITIYHSAYIKRGGRQIWPHQNQK